MPVAPLRRSTEIGDHFGVIFETDQALATLLKTRVLGGAAVGVAFDPPSRPWIQALTGPVVNLFLFDLRENPHRHESWAEDVRDATGRVIGRRPPMQRWDLHYTVSVFAPAVIVEHKILAGVLRYLAQIDVLPEDVLPPALAEPGYPILVSTGAGPKRGMFLNYAGDVKASFEMAITVPIVPLATPSAPPVRQPPQIVVGPAGRPSPAGGSGATETARTGQPTTPGAPPRGAGGPRVAPRAPEPPTLSADVVAVDAPTGATTSQP